MFNRFKSFVSEKIETLNKPDVVAPILKSESTPVKPEATTQPVTDSVKQQESAKSINTTQSQPVSAPSIKSLQTKEKLPDPKILKPAPLTPSTFSLDSLFKSKKPVAPIDYDIPLQLWKNLPSNNGLFLIRRNENIWNMIHENNIDLARAAERTDRKLHTAISASNKNFRTLKEFEQVIVTLPAILNQVVKITKQVDEIRSRCTTLEEVFDSLAMARYEKATGKWKKMASDNSLNYSEAKKEELIRLEYKLQIEKDKADREESIRLNLIRLEQERKERGEREEKERLEKLEKQEKERKERLEKQEKERLEKLELERLRREEQEKIDKVRQEYEREQQAFEKAFKMQMDNFIESGGASIENITPIKVDTTLEDLQVDDDNADLLNFLGSDDDEGETGDNGNSDDDDNTHIEVLPIIDEPELEYKSIKNPLILE